MVNKGSSFTDFVRYRPHTYARTQQSLPPLWAAITSKKTWDVIKKNTEEKTESPMSLFPILSR